MFFAYFVTKKFRVVAPLELCGKEELLLSLLIFIETLDWYAISFREVVYRFIIWHAYYIDS